MSLATENIFRARWTEQIHDEWIRNVLANRSDVQAEQLERTRQLMNLHAEDCLVTGYEALISALTLPDPDDRHILAAAVKGQCDVIVTYNQKDFPPEALVPFDLLVQHPDDFLCLQFDLAPEAFLNAVRKHRARLKHPPFSQSQYLETLIRQRLVQLVQTLQHATHKF